MRRLRRDVRERRDVLDDRRACLAGLEVVIGAKVRIDLRRRYGEAVRRADNNTVLGADSKDAPEEIYYGATRGGESRVIRELGYIVLCESVYRNARDSG